MPAKNKRTRPAWVFPVAIALLITAIAAVLFFVSYGRDVPTFNTQGIVASKEKDLMVFTMLLSVVVIVPVFTLLGVFAWKYRDGSDRGGYTPDVDGGKWMELLWWGIPIAIIGTLSVITWVTTHDLDPQKPLDSHVKPLKVQVVALQWKWLFIYPEQHVASLQKLKIPAGTPVNFEITADAPMSAFWIPSLGSQVYAMSGMSSKLSLMADRPGTYRGTNTNINGKGYADMDFEVESVDSRAVFDKWAKVLVNSSDHTSLDWDLYKEIAKPSKVDAPKFYHLHDQDLYTKVIDKYAMAEGSSHGGSEASSATHMKGEEH